GAVSGRPEAVRRPHRSSIAGGSRNTGTTITFGTPPRRIDALNWLSGVTWWGPAASERGAREVEGILRKIQFGLPV
ncbi:MAG TPA: hypothetical protein VMI31_15440, partial [Fimbriimonadaceae bacterium]|nr:hypothetical protein [Fimbriimonadaceae bacterium]